MAERKGKKGKKQSLKEAVASIVGRRLAEARKGAKHTQSAIAERISVVPGYISLVEQGQRLPSVEVLVAWGDACGVPVSEFFTGLEAELRWRRAGLFDLSLAGRLGEAEP